MHQIRTADLTVFQSFLFPDKLTLRFLTLVFKSGHCSLNLVSLSCFVILGQVWSILRLDCLRILGWWYAPSEHSHLSSQTWEIISLHLFSLQSLNPPAFLPVKALPQTSRENSFTTLFASPWTLTKYFYFLIVAIFVPNSKSLGFHFLLHHSPPFHVQWALR